MAIYYFLYCILSPLQFQELKQGQNTDTKIVIDSLSLANSAKKQQQWIDNIPR